MVQRVQFSLRSLFIFMTLAGILCWIAYLVTRPFHTIARVNCGSGRYVELLRPNEFCDVGGPLHFRFTGMKKGPTPPSFVLWGCGDTPELVVLHGVREDIVALALANARVEVLIAIDFKSGSYWPDDWHRKVTTQGESMLQSVRAQHGEVWLWSTYDSRFSNPRP